MPPWLTRLLQRRVWQRVPWARLWLAGRWLYKHGRERLERNLTTRERQELLHLTKKSRGRRSNLTAREQQRLRDLVRKGATGRR